MSLTTTVDSVCRYDEDDVAYDQMTGDFRSDAHPWRVHVAHVQFTNSTDKTYYVRCQNMATGAVNTASAKLWFSVDLSGEPVLSGLEPSGTQGADVKLEVQTDVIADCSYSETDEAYDAMPEAFDTVDGKIHTKELHNLTSGEKQYFVRCKNRGTDVVNTSSAEITFVVDLGPGRPYLLPSGTVTGPKVLLEVVTDVVADCRYSTADDDYDTMPETFDTAYGKLHSKTIYGVADGAQEYYVRCKNHQTLEKNTTPAIISFTVDSNASIPLVTENIFLNQMASAVGNFLVPSAMAQDAVPTTDTGAANVTDPTDGDDFIEEGKVGNGSGTGTAYSKLEKLKPGTFFYARAYAVVNGVTYYGNQVGFRTGDSCFVATAAFGSIFHPYVRILRDFRDSYLLDNQLGRTLVSLYYKYSPPVADVIAADSGLRLAVRILLLPIVGLAWLLMQLGVPGLLLVGVAGAGGIYALRPASGCLRT
jgi:hypothetical protein